MSESTGTVPLADLAPEGPGSPSEAAAEKAKSRPTEYHILKLASSSGANETWSVHARNVEAQGAQAAIRKAVTDADKSQTFVAVPSRSFKPITVTMETKTQLVLS